MAEKKVLELKKEVADKYNVMPGIGVGACAFKGQTIYLDQLTVAEADELVAAGMDVLVAKKAAPAAKA